MVTSIFVWGWPIQRSWLQGRARGWVWCACMVLGLAAIGALWQLHQSIRTRLGDLHAQSTRARARVELTPPAAMPVEQDFAQSLGAPLQAALVTQELQRACSASGVLLASVQAQEHLASADQLGRLDLAVTLRGPYPGIKLVLKHILERFPGSTLQRLRMRHAQAGAEVETGFTLSIWSAPQRPSEQSAHGVSSVTVR